MSRWNLEKPLSMEQNFSFEEMEHTADVALRIQGRDLESLLTAGARGMATLLCEDISDLSEKIEQEVQADADDAESLLVEWLSELAFFAETRSQVFIRFEFQELSRTYLSARAFGQCVENLKTHIKAETYHNLEILETKTGLSATVVFDI